MLTMSRASLWRLARECWDAATVFGAMSDPPWRSSPRDLYLAENIGPNAIEAQGLATAAICMAQLAVGSDGQITGFEAPEPCKPDIPSS